MARGLKRRKMTVSGGHWISLTPGGHQRAFKEDAHKKGKGGYLSIGGRWYRKPLTLPAIPKGLDLWIEPDGVYMNSDVRINGASSRQPSPWLYQFLLL